ncbi:MAG: sugar transferase [Myxococcota bacterium]
MNDTGETFDPDSVVSHWERPADLRHIRRWQRRLAYKKLIWRGTFGLAESIKRAMDIAGSLAAITVFSPVFMGTALLIKIEDGGPILFRQDRVGRGGRLFKMIKFRSMVPNADKLKDQLLAANQHGGEGVTFKMKDDPRITRVGRFIRKYSVDEFPQFFNVLFGDMSLVGPRPPVPREVAKYKAMHLRRLAVKPGITCLWQVGGRAEIDFEGQVRLDLQYIASESVWNDVKILLKTVPAVLKGEGAY